MPTELAFAPHQRQEDALDRRLRFATVVTALGNAGTASRCYAPFMNAGLQSAPIGAEAWARVVGGGFVGYLLVELKKWLCRRGA